MEIEEKGNKRKRENVREWTEKRFIFNIEVNILEKNEKVRII
jgi:hypothetical protein